MTENKINKYTVDPNFEPSERLRKIAFILRNACIRRVIARREEASRKLLEDFAKLTETACCRKEESD